MCFRGDRNFVVYERTQEVTHYYYFIDNSLELSNITIEKGLYRRSRGSHILFRLKEFDDYWYPDTLISRVKILDNYRITENEMGKYKMIEELYK